MILYQLYELRKNIIGVVIHSATRERKWKILKVHSNNKVHSGYLMPYIKVLGLNSKSNDSDSTDLSRTLVDVKTLLRKRPIKI